MQEKIKQLCNEWLSLQPLSANNQKRLDDKFRLEFNYNSNHIEGNTLTYGQTKLLLFFGETEGRHELREYEEMKAHDVALKIVKNVAKDKERPLNENFIRELNKIILVEPFYKEAETADGQKTRMEVKIGEYKSRANHVRTITGETFHYASPEETPAMMSDLIAWYNTEEEKKELSPVELAALLHYRYIRIHPFEDGNGRIARLLLNYVLLKNGYPMLIVKTKDKDNYLRILHQCDVNVGLTPADGANAPLDKITPFVEYMSQQLEESLTMCIKAAKGENIEESDDLDKRIAVIERQLQANKKQEKDVIKYSIIPLIEAWNNAFSKFDKLFFSKDFDISVGGSIYLSLDGLIANIEFLNIRNIDIIVSLRFNGLKGAKNMLIHKLSLKITKGNESYSAFIFDENISTKKNSELYTEDEIHKIVKYGTDLFIKRLQSEIQNE